jgi:hypothetical protein
MCCEWILKKRKHVVRLMGMCVALWLLNSASVYALTVPDVRGVYNGTGTTTLTGCQDPADNITVPGNVTNTVSSQTGASLSGTLLITASFPGVLFLQTAPFTGTVASDGSVNGTFTYTTTVNGFFDSSGTGTFSGTLVGNTLTGSANTQDTVGDTCQAAVSLTATRSGPVPPPVPTGIITGMGDLDGNGTADMLWRDTATGAVEAWFMNELDVSSSAVLATIPPDWVAVLATIPPDWVIGGVGDLDGNGTADVVWRHPSSGTVAAWYMTIGTGAVGSSAVLATGLPGDWIITGMGDLDGNGTADVVWRAIGSSAVLATIPPDWVIGGVGDLDGNGTADVLWRHPSSGTVAAWYMTIGTGAVGPSKVLATGLPGDWIIGDIGDLDNNGTADVIWRHVPTGLVAAWLMTPGTGEVGTSGVIATIPADWIIAGMGDLNLGIGPADVVWHHPSSGLAAGWLMNGLTVDDSGVIDAP